MPCRHHIGEIILTWSWNALKFNLSTSPQINLFGRFKANFHKLNYKKGDCLFIPEHSDFVKSERDSIVFQCEKALEQGFARGDYRELIMLSLVFLNACFHDVIMIQKPGACHKARWMAKLIYSLKMILLSKQINKLGSKTVFRTGQYEKLVRFVEFFIVLYLPWWITSSCPSTAPQNDVKLLKSLIKHQDVQPIITRAALKSLANHMWYLCEELVPLALFSNHMENSEKSLLQKKLLQIELVVPERSQKRHGTGFGKPTFPPIPNLPFDLSHFVGPESWRFFKILQLDCSFVRLPVSEWAANDAFLQGKEIVENLRVVNDTAERGVKLCHDFIGCVKKETNLQSTLQVVEHHRQQAPHKRSNHSKKL